MRREFIPLLISILFISCVREEVKLPQIAMEGETEIQNHSEVWMFYKENEAESPLKLNKNNTISTTHWLYNIDKRLQLKHIIPELQELRYKHANGMHSEEGMLNYLSYSNTLNNQLTYRSFDYVTYKTDSLQSKFFIKQHADDYRIYNNIHLTINPNNTWINDAKMVDGELLTTLPEFIEFSAEGRQTLLHINFNQNLSYQEYMSYQAYLNSLASAAIRINPLEFVFNPSKVPDCGCE